MMDRINRLDRRKMENQEEIKNLEDRKKQYEDEIKDIKNKKQVKIDNLKKRIEEMSHDFSGMLKETLENMRDKIKSANEKWEQENDGAMLKRFEEYANPKAN